MNAITIRKSVTPHDSISQKLYLKDISHTKPLSRDEEYKLGMIIKYGKNDAEIKAAKDKLIISNLRFVVTVAKQYQGRGLELEDLIAEGEDGLIHAADLFDAEKGFKFISYAVWWIRQSILKAIFNLANTVRLPSSQIDPINKINKIKTLYDQKYQREPTIEELSEETGYTEEKIQDLLTSTNFCISINAPLTDDDEGTGEDVIENPEADATDKECNNHILAEIINRELDKLPDRESDIICLVFGLNGIDPMGFEDIGRKFALTGERIRQIKEGLLKKFRTNNTFKGL